IISSDACEQGTASISLIKTGALEDLNQDGCQESILYTFTVTNNGDVALDSVILLDNLFGGEVVGPITGSDQNEDGVLSPAESWTFEAIYAIVQEDIDLTFVENTATVTAEIFDTDIPIQDISHPSDEALDGPTQTDVPDTACTTGAPSIELNKIGNLHDFNNDGCIESILYSFSVTNTGDFDLLEVVLQDDFLGGTIDGPDPNTDVGNDNVLSIGESWNYQVLYSLVPNDINSTINNQAVVSAKPENLDVIISNGDSDSTMVPSDVCTSGGPGIALVKTGELDDLDSDGCNESIRYTFTVSNIGSANLSEITLEDQKLGDVISTQPSPGEDIGDDGILSVGESWTFTANYIITEIDIESGSVVNQATVFATIAGQQTKVSDLSDDNSPLENNPTETLVPEEICTFTNIDPDFEIFNGITPNGDGINDHFQINGIEAYPDNILKIFNRWGALVYEAEGYGIGNKLFTGVSEGKATVSKENELPGGTYFYILEFPNENPDEKSYSGYLFISNNN
ncbi:MAG: gliding motility-associated C-terminal domain-containing protein, partial [Algicola sp.]|nr:gliding motility-associated C-terminal domain-containing protein [Algicola sp.]